MRDTLNILRYLKKKGPPGAEGDEDQLLAEEEIGLEDEEEDEKKTSLMARFRDLK